MQFEQLLGCGTDLLSKPLSNSACMARFKPILFQVAPHLSELYSLWITVLAAKQAASAKHPIFDCEYWHCGRSEIHPSTAERVLGDQSRRGSGERQLNLKVH
jgi:hypothetical protein